MRYVPGNIWQPLSLTLYSRRYGVPAEATVTSIALYQVMILLAAAPLAAIYFVWIDTQTLAGATARPSPLALGGGCRRCRSSSL